jgi:ABC-type Zn uptake system ZnuABC Zn-binding protein ZnuA
MVETARDELKKFDPGHAAGYDRRAAEYLKKLDALQAEGKAALAGKKDRQFITFHDSMRYFVRPFDLKVAGAIEPRAGVEPDARQIGKLVEMCKAQGVRLLTKEPQYPAASAERVLEEIKRQGVEGARIVELDPMETVAADPDGHGGPAEFKGQAMRDFYERKLRANIQALAGGLQ